MARLTLPVTMRPWPVLLAALMVAAGIAGCRSPQGDPAANAIQSPDAAALDNAAVTPIAPVTVAAATTGQAGVSATKAPEPAPAATLSRGSVRGHVTRPDGAAVSDVGVTITEGTAITPAMAVYTDAAGMYVWYLPVGTFTVQAARDGYETATADVTIEAGVETNLDFTLQPN